MSADPGEGGAGQEDAGREDAVDIAAVHERS